MTVPEQTWNFENIPLHLQVVLVSDTDSLAQYQ